MRDQKTPKLRKGRPPKSRRESLQPNENSNLKPELALVCPEPETSNSGEKEAKGETDPGPRLGGSFVSPDKSDESDTVSVNGEGNCSSNTSLIECSGFKGPSSQSSVSQENSNYAYEIGTRLEAKDLGNEIWYAAKVVEVDWEEEEILIHFEKWSQRYDEWIPMDSSRLRPAKARPEPPKKSFKDFKVGEKVMATWSDSRKYLAQIKAVLPNDRYEVLFYDGFTKIIRAGRISKHDEGEAYVENEFRSPQVKEELKVTVSESVLNESLSPDNATDSIGTKEDRRARKRKLNFAELFHFKKRSRFDKDSSLSGKGLLTAKRGRKKHMLVGHEQATEVNEADKLQVSEHAVGSGAEAQSVSTPSVVKRKRGRRRVECDSEGSAEKVVKRPRSHFSETKEKDTEYKPPGRKLKLKTEDSHTVNKIVAQRKGEDDSFKKEDSNSTPTAESKKPIEEEWRPEGEVAYVIGGADGPRQSIIMADDRVPEGWVKHCIQRMSGNSAGKWDVFFLSPHGKKFRTKHDLKNYYEEKGEKFPIHAFDFSLRQKKGPRAVGGDSLSSGVVLPVDPGKKSKPGRRRSSGVSESEFPEQGLVQKRVKTLLPKVRLPQNEEGIGDGVVQSSGSTSPYLTAGSGNSPISRSMEEAAGGVFVGSLRVQRENDAFKCPKDGCNKNFRKENLLQMHIKHYHPEYNKFMGSTPNVADLAYARTIGEPVEDIVPKSRYSVKSPAFLEKINRFEATRKVKVGEMVLSDKKKAPLFKEKVTTISPTVKRTLKEYLEDDKYQMGTDSLNEQAVTVDLRSGESGDHVLPSIPSSTGAPEATPVDDPEQAVARAFSPAARIQSADLEERIKTKMPVLEKVDVLNEGTEIGVKREVESPHVLPPTLVSQSKSARTIRKKHLTDFHMEPVHRKRKPALKITEALDKSDSTEEGLLTEGDDSGGARTPSVYHFSKKKNPMVQLEKLNVTADSNGRVNLSTLDKHLLSQIKGTEGQGKSASDAGVTSTKLEHLRKEEIINCTCEVTEEDGLMIQCDLCLCWQHGICNNIEKEEDVPEKYVCQICLNPNKERLSRKYVHNQDWLKEGKLPSLSFRSKDINKILQREKILKRSHDLTAELVKLEQMLHNINVKIDIAGNGEHPKLILWSKTWSQKVNNCAQVKEEHQEEIKSVETPVAASASLKVEPDTAVVEESEVNLGTEVEIEAEEEVVSSEDKTQLEESVPAVEKSDSCDSESNTVETKGEDKDSLENCTSSTCEEIEHPSESVNVSGDLKLEPDDDDRISVEQQKEEKEVEVVLVPQESDVVVDNVQELITEGTEKQVKDSEEKEELGDKGGNVVDEEENCEGEVSKRDEEADTTETGDEDGSLLQQALTSDLNQADGDIQLPLCQSELMQLATSIVGNLEDADVDELSTKCVSAPVPEAPIDFVVCQRTLIDHIEQYQQKIDERLTSLEAQLAELESQEPDLDDESPLYCPRTKQTIQMLLRDLGAMRQIGSINSD